MQSFSTANSGNPLNKFSKLSQEESEILEKLRYDPDYNPSKDQLSKESTEYKDIVQERAKALKQLEKYKQSENIIKMINDRLKTAQSSEQAELKDYLVSKLEQKQSPIAEVLSTKLSTQKKDQGKSIEELIYQHAAKLEEGQ